MELVYIDESGSMTTDHCNSKGNKYFCIALILVKNKAALKKRFKRLIAKNIDILKTIDNDNRMFDKNGKFIELKGNLLTVTLKKKFALYLCNNNYFEVLFTKVNNPDVKPILYQNTARAFNYILNKSLFFFHQGGLLNKDEYLFQIDERNTKTKSIYALEDYLNLDLVMDKDIMTKIRVEYYDSANNSLIQVADLFANIFLSQCYTNNYKDIFELLTSKGYFHKEFIFPYKPNIKL